MRIHRGAVDRVAARRVAAVRPVQKPVLEIELQINGLRQAIEQYFDVGAIGRVFALRDFTVRPKEAAGAPLLRPFLRPVDLTAPGVNRDADTPSRGVRPRSGIAVARVDEG